MANGKRLIDANEVKERIWHGNSDPSGMRQYASGFIDNAPTVDAVEVVHGRWLDVKETDVYVPDMKFTITHTAETCSNCKVRIGFVGAKRYLFDVTCPNCGAKMDGGNEDGQHNVLLAM